MKDYRLFSCCILVEGAKRDIIYDLQRNQLYYSTKELSKILHPHNDDLFINLDEDLKEYINYLISEEVLFQSNDFDNFPEMEISFEKNNCYQIQTLVCIINNFSDLNLIKERLGSLTIRSARIEIHDEFNAENIEAINDFGESLNVLYCDFSIHNSKDKGSSLLKKVSNRFSNIYHINSENVNRYETDEFGRSEFFISSNILEEPITPSLDHFRINIEMMNESMYHSSFYNGRIYLSEDLNAYFDYEQKLGLGNIKDISNGELMSLLKASPLNVKKDLIETCKDCEYRYMCLDNRKTQENKGKYSYENKCNYNPYSSTWTKH